MLRRHLDGHSFDDLFRSRLDQRVLIKPFPNPSERPLWRRL